MARHCSHVETFWCLLWQHAGQGQASAAVRHEAECSAEPELAPHHCSRTPASLCGMYSLQFPDASCAAAAADTASVVVVAVVVVAVVVVAVVVVAVVVVAVVAGVVVVATSFGDGHWIGDAA